MDRPSLNPIIDAEPTARAKRRAPLTALGRCVLGAARALAKAMVLDVGLRRRGLRIDDGAAPWRRVLRGMAYRMVFLPVVIVAAVAALVFTATHPPAQAAIADPVSQGVYYDPVVLLCDDGVHLEAWLVPTVDARRIVREKDSALRHRDPAVVLVHDFGMSRQQMLPLVGPLHDAGFVVLVLSTRGCGSSDPAAATFGLNEAMDVKAAVELLRRGPFVNPRAIAVLGIGTGATAALLAARNDPYIPAVVLDKPVHNFDDMLAQHMGLEHAPGRWLLPVSKWSFEIVFGVNAQEGALDNLIHALNGRSALVFDDRAACTLQPGHTRQITDFLHRAMSGKASPVAASY